MVRVTASVDGLHWAALVAAVTLNTGYDLSAERAKGLYTG